MRNGTSFLCTFLSTLSCECLDTECFPGDMRYPDAFPSNSSANREDTNLREIRREPFTVTLESVYLMILVSCPIVFFFLRFQHSGYIAVAFSATSNQALRDAPEIAKKLHFAPVFRVFSIDLFLLKPHEHYIFRHLARPSIMSRCSFSWCRNGAKEVQKSGIFDAKTVQTRYSCGAEYWSIRWEANSRQAL